MTDYFPLDGSETFQLNGEELELSRAYYVNGLRNSPLRVWGEEEIEVHYNGATATLRVYEHDGDQYLAEIAERDGDTLVLERAR